MHYIWGYCRGCRPHARALYEQGEQDEQDFHSAIQQSAVNQSNAGQDIKDSRGEGLGGQKYSCQPIKSKSRPQSKCKMKWGGAGLGARN